MEQTFKKHQQSFYSPIQIPLQNTHQISKTLQPILGKNYLFVSPLIIVKSDTSNFTNLSTFAKRNNPYQNIYLQKPSETAKKLQQQLNDGIPNYTKITNETKEKINKSRVRLAYLLHPFDRKKAKQQFLLFSKKSKILDIEFELETFQINYPSQKRNAAICIKQYTGQSFFYRVLNKGLRVLKRPQESGYLRLPFSDIFLSIRELYKEQRKFRYKSIKCFRGCRLSEKEINDLRKNIGEYIQLQGFISTSEKKEAAVAFCQKNAGSVLLEITIPQQKSQRQLNYDYGFAFVQKYTKWKGEGEILINSINIFKIEGITNQIIEKLDNHKQYTIVKLKYIRVEQIQPLHKALIGHKQKQLLENFKYFEGRLQNIKNQGFAFFSHEQFQLSRKWFKKQKQRVYDSLIKFLYYGQKLKKEELQKLFDEYSEALYMECASLNNLQEFQESLQILKLYKEFFLKSFKDIIKANYYNEFKEVQKKIKYNFGNEQYSKIISYNKNPLKIIDSDLQKQKNGKGKFTQHNIILMVNKIMLLSMEQQWKKVIICCQEITSMKKQLKTRFEKSIFYYEAFAHLKQLEIQKAKNSFQLFFEELSKAQKVNFQQVKMVLQLLVGISEIVGSFQIQKLQCLLYLIPVYDKNMPIEGKYQEYIKFLSTKLPQNKNHIKVKLLQFINNFQKKI